MFIFYQVVDQEMTVCIQKYSAHDSPLSCKDDSEKINGVFFFSLFSLLNEHKSSLRCPMTKILQYSFKPWICVFIGVYACSTLMLAELMRMKEGGRECSANWCLG